MGYAYCPICILLFTAFISVALILVKKKANDTYFHIHMMFPSTWSHVWRVEKNTAATPKRAQKKVATTKSSRLPTQSCENFKAALPT
jgi:hypothetical protein